MRRRYGSSKMTTRLVRRRALLALALTVAALSPSLNCSAEPATTTLAPYVQSATSCRALGPAMVDLVAHTGNALVDATKAGFAADSLKNGADFKTIETSAADVHREVLMAYMALGPVMGSDIGNGRVRVATAAVAREAQGELQVAQLLTQLSVTYERVINAQRKRDRLLLMAAPFLLVAPIAAAGFMEGAMGAQRTTSTTTGTINGQQFSATTSTEDYSRVNAIQAAVAANQAGRKEALELYTPQVGTLVYVINPLAWKWITACRAAKQLPATVTGLRDVGLSLPVAPKATPRPPATSALLSESAPETFTASDNEAIRIARTYGENVTYYQRLNPTYSWTIISRYSNDYANRSTEAFDPALRGTPEGLYPIREVCYCKSPAPGQYLGTFYEVHLDTHRTYLIVGNKALEQRYGLQHNPP